MAVHEAGGEPGAASSAGPGALAAAGSGVLGRQPAHEHKLMQALGVMEDRIAASLDHDRLTGGWGGGGEGLKDEGE